MEQISRRRFITRSTLLGCSAAAAPFLTPVTLLAAPWETRLVVIILRGAMDGLDVVRPIGDPDFKALRPSLSEPDGLDLDGFFALHPGLGDLMPLWHAGQLGFAHAVSTPYRDKRSHFDGQDLLEAGTGFDVQGDAVRDGWLNRMLQTVPGTTAETAFAIGQGGLKLLSGSAPTSAWSPEAQLGLTPATQTLMARVAASDPLFANAFERAVAIASSLDEKATKGAPHLRVAGFAAAQLREKARVAAFSINGWDTHSNQTGGLKRPLAALSDTVLALQSGLGPLWDRTAVLAMTEFGRTARENGTRGTDHGTGGAMLMAGGAIRGGRVYGQWPGLREADLYARRDLMPLGDVRAYGARAMQGLFGLDRDVLEGAVFPGLDIANAPEIML